MRYSEISEAIFSIRICLSVFFALFIATSLLAGSYEGVIGSYPVWLDLEIPTKDVKVQGSYFYQKTGVSIRLDGERKADSISLTEYNEQGKVSGRFLCFINGKEITGNWISGNGKKKFTVAAKETDPQRMKDAQQEALLNAHDAEMLKSEFPEDECSKSQLSYSFKNKYLRSLSLGTEYSCGPYPSGQSVYKTYDAQTLNDIHFWDEIDSNQVAALIAYLSKETQRKLIECRKAYPDSEWVNIFSSFSSDIVQSQGFGEDPQNALDKIFTVGNVGEMMSEFFIESDGVHLGRCGFFGFPHAIMAMDFCDYVVISPTELDKYLKPNSIFKKVGK